MTSSALDDYLLPRHNQAGALLLSDSVQLLEYNTTYTNWLPIVMNLVNNAALRAYVVQRVPAHACAMWVHAPLTRCGGVRFRASHGIGDNINAARVAYDPFPLTSAESKPSNAQFLSAGLIGLYIALGFSAIPGLQALRVVKEREVKCKQQQFIMGMKPAAYWVGNLMWDSLQYLVPWVLCLLILYVLCCGTALAFSAHCHGLLPQVFRWHQRLPGWQQLLCGGRPPVVVRHHQPVPCVRHFLHVRQTYQCPDLHDACVLCVAAAAWRVGVQVLSHPWWWTCPADIGTIVSFMSVFALSYPSVSVPTIVPEILDYAFSLFPNYALAKGMMDVNTKASCFQFGGPGASPTQSCLHACMLVVAVWMTLVVWCIHAAGPLCELPSPFQWDILGQKLAFLGAGIPLWLAVVLLLEHVLAPKPPAGATKPYDMDRGMEYEDKDVRSERERVDTGRADRDNVVVRHLRKVFPAQNNQPMKVAVGDLTIGCREGECLGLLGPNGTCGIVPCGAAVPSCCT